MNRVIKTTGLLLAAPLVNLLVLLRPWASLPAAPIHFEDVTATTGLSLERVVSQDKRYIVETTGGGVAFLDYNNDGWMDVYLTNCPTVESSRAKRFLPNRLYRNNGNRTFSDVSKEAGVDFRGWSMGVSVADYDADGDEDLYLTNFGPNVLYRNNGDGTFSDVTQRAARVMPVIRHPAAGLTMMVTAIWISLLRITLSWILRNCPRSDRGVIASTKLSRFCADRTD